MPTCSCWLLKRSGAWAELLTASCAQVAEKQQRLSGMQSEINVLTNSSRSRLDILISVQVGAARVAPASPSPAAACLHLARAALRQIWHRPCHWLVQEQLAALKAEQESYQREDVAGTVADLRADAGRSQAGQAVKVLPLFELPASMR